MEDANPCADSFGEFPKDKFKNVLHYIIHNTGHINNVGKTVLFKVLYFTDFNYYELFEEKLTGETYLKYPFGPAPCDFDEVVFELELEGAIRETEYGYGTYRQIKFFSNTEPDISKLSRDELDFIDKTIDSYSRFSAKEVSELSHHDAPYIAAEDFEELDYEMVFYRTSELSVRNYDDEDGSY